MSKRREPRAYRGLRVIGGSIRGYRLNVPSGEDVRPTLDRIRESLFSILGDTVAGSVVLDAFAGSGALGIEALSRGAKCALFCDDNPDCVRTIQGNLERCGLNDRAVVLRVKVPEGFSRIRKSLAEPCDLVFLDPPYRAEGKERLLEEFHRFALLKEHARIVFEHSQKDTFACVPAGFDVERERRYGDTLVTFLNYQPGEKRDDGR
jgi:16S rRNA (guanine(966)-N(2))-methyltransferase RsmD